MRRTGLALSLAACLTPASALAQETLAECAAIADDAGRLQCYDRLAGGYGIVRAQPAPSEAPLPQAEAQAPPPEPAASLLARSWELEPGTQRGLFRLRSHNPNYLMATWSSSPNTEPYRPFEALAPDTELSQTELAFQISFKMKLAERPLDAPLDLWFGYTQSSFWQAANPEASSPFRATDYRPELMAVFPVDMNLLGMRLRFVNLGLVHESNGQASSLSRSWNRAYAQAGLERGNFTLLGRVWKRFEEDAASDDNPDILNYLGHGDVVAGYRRRGHEFSLTARRNFATDKGAVQLGWAFPLSERQRRLKGYVQLFSGYGYSLIDYNHRQDVIGIGFVVTE